MLFVLINYGISTPASSHYTWASSKAVKLSTYYLYILIN